MFWLSPKVCLEDIAFGNKTAFHAFLSCITVFVLTFGGVNKVLGIVAVVLKNRSQFLKQNQDLGFQNKISILPEIHGQDLKCTAVEPTSDLSQNW